MQRNNDHIKHFNASDIQRYLRGEMSASEMHELERSALDDPFLADAIEGYSRQYGNASADADLALLRQKLASEHSKPGTESSKPATVVQMKKNYWWRVAAIFIVLAGTGVVVFSLLNNNSSETRSLAKRENQVPAEPVRDKAAQSNALMDSTAAVPPAVVMNQSAKPADHTLSKSAQPEKKARADTKEEIKTSTDAAASQKLDEAVVVGYSRKAAQANEKKVEQAFRGKVTDQDNKPIEGASVSMNSKPAAVSDREGNFIVKAPDTTVNVKVSSEGYQTELATLKNKEEPTPIKLEEKLSGKAAGVSGNRELAKRKAVIYSPAEPVIGWTGFETYLNQNKKLTLPDFTNGNEVQLTFSINRKGRPVNIKVEKPLSPTADSEALRLLKDGPDWKYTTSQKDKAAVVIKL